MCVSAAGDGGSYSAPLKTGAGQIDNAVAKERGV